MIPVWTTLDMIVLFGVGIALGSCLTICIYCIWRCLTE